MLPTTGLAKTAKVSAAAAPQIGADSYATKPPEEFLAHAPNRPPTGQILPDSLHELRPVEIPPAPAVLLPRAAKATGRTADRSRSQNSPDRAAIPIASRYRPRT